MPSDNDDFELTPTSEEAAHLNEANEERKARDEKRTRLDFNVPDYTSERSALARPTQGRSSQAGR